MIWGNFNNNTSRIVTECFHFKDGLNVELIHKQNNGYAAKKAMYNAYRRKESDVSFSGGKRQPGLSYIVFDGRDFD